MLAACHERIEAQLRTLERLGPHLEAKGCDAEARAAAQGRDEIAAAVEELEREHETMEAQWRRLREHLLAIAQGEARFDTEEVARFAWLYRRHLDREAAALMPFAREALDAQERAALGSRMAARRNKD
jgi:hemerythrin-like domain-containing protein